jgi:ketosteroid isomerase-like protein
MPEESSTPDLVEITLGIFEAMDRDWDVDAVATHWSPDVVWETLGGMGTYEGAAAVRLFMEGWWSTWEDHRHHVEEIRDLGHGVVYVVVRKRVALLVAAQPSSNGRWGCSCGSMAGSPGSCPTSTSTRIALPPNGSRRRGLRRCRRLTWTSPSE